MNFDSFHFWFEKTKFLDLAFALGVRWAKCAGIVGRQIRPFGTGHGKDAKGDPFVNSYRVIRKFVIGRFDSGSFRSGNLKF